MADSENRNGDRDTSAAGGSDIPPWLQAVPEGEENISGLSGNKMLIAAIAGAVAVIALFVSVIFYFYENSVPTAPIVATAPKTAIKEKPVDPGGMTVEHQDKAIFDQADGLKPRPEVSLGEQPEKPVSEIVDDPLGDTIEAVTAEDENTSIEAPVSETPTATEGPTPAAAEEPTPDESVDSPEPTPIMANAYRIQLGAYATENSASRAWRAVKGKGIYALTDKEAEFEAVQSGDRTLYRLRVGPYADRIAADQACLALRAVEQACIVVNP